MDRRVEARALDLAEEALDLPSDERRAWLATACAGDAALLARVMTLLSRDASFRHILTGGARLLAEDAPLPERIGAYRITGLIGQGGMGAVYRGERATGDFEHVAAIKLVRPGVLSSALAERFQAERQTLARLSHPHIARLFDGGETADGAPYIVMELIEGRPLDQWLEAEAPSRPARTAQFLAICDAVGFAHRNLVIHRDITPSNILVDRAGTAKLIDFGIARPPVVEDAMPPSGRPPSLTGLSLTPGFAAPERQSGAAVTTLSDIYSLGVLLGRMMADGQDRDLAAIVARAGATDPADRYPTVDALRDDVVAWRDGMVVSARNGGRRYLIGKFVRRHRAAVTAAAAVLLLLVGAIMAVTLSYLRAERARVEAETRFQQTRAIAKTMLFDVYDEVSRIPGSTRARALLARTGVAYLDALAANRATPDLVRAEVGRGYTRLAQVTGGGQHSDLGRYADANALLAQAERVLKPLAAARPDLPAVRIAYADLLVEQAGTNLYNNNEPGLAGDQARRARTVLTGLERASSDAARLYVLTYQAEADSHGWVDDYARARLVLERIPPFVAALPPAIRGSRDVRLAEASALRLYGEALHKLKREPAAMAVLDRAVALYDGLSRADPDDPALRRKLVLSLWYRGVVLRTNGRDAAAAASLGRALALAETIRARDPHDQSALQLFAAVGEVQAQMLADQRRFAESYALTDRVIAAQRRRAALAEQAPGAVRSVASVLRTGGGNHYNGGDYAGACRLWEEALAIYRGFDRAGKLTPADRDGAYREMGDYVARGCRGGPPRSLGVDAV